MPVVLKHETWPVWLGEEAADTSSLKDLLAAVSIGRDDLLARERAGRGTSRITTRA
jgi:hypothetical protein